MASTSLMAIDRAVKTTIFYKFQDIMGFTDLKVDVVIHAKETAFRHIAEKRGDATLEFANVWCTGVEESSRASTFASNRGLAYARTVDGDAMSLKAVPTKLRYSVWFWTKDLDRVKSIQERVLFWKYNDPNIEMFYGADIPLSYDIKDRTVTDESPISSMFNIGMYFVVRLEMVVEGLVFSEQFASKIINQIFVKCYQDIDPNGPREKEILLFEDTIQ